MNEDYASLRVHTLDDIKQVVDFFRLEIEDTAEIHNTIECSLAEAISEWVPIDFEQIEITSGSFGDDLVISVMFTNTSGVIDDQFVVVHKEPDMFNTSALMLEAILDKRLPSAPGEFDWFQDTQPMTYTSPFEESTTWSAQLPAFITDEVKFELDSPFDTSSIESIPLSLTISADGGLEMKSGTASLRMSTTGDLDFNLDELEFELDDLEASTGTGSQPFIL